MIARIANGGLIFFNRRKTRKSPTFLWPIVPQPQIIELRQVINPKTENRQRCVCNATAPEFFSAVPTSPRAARQPAKLNNRAAVA
jgi:hypothetical protein